MPFGVRRAHARESYWSWAVYAPPHTHTARLCTLAKYCPVLERDALKERKASSFLSPAEDGLLAMLYAQTTTCKSDG